mgnify:CR=1 FL=1
MAIQNKSKVSKKQMASAEKENQEKEKIVSKNENLTWNQFVKEFRAKNPELSFKEALKQASEPYRQMKTQA